MSDMMKHFVWEAARCAIKMRAAKPPGNLSQLNQTRSEALAQVQALLDSGENPSAIDDANSDIHTSSIIIASANGDLAILQMLLSSPLTDVNLPDREEDTALLLAAKNGHPHCILALLEARARLDVRNREGRTPLMLAVESGVVESCAIIAPLCDWSWDDRAGNGDTLFKIAQESRNRNVLPFLDANMEERLLSEACPSINGASSRRLKSL